MNTNWSDSIIGIDTLVSSRKLRFDDMFFDRYESLFGIDSSRKLKILEIGCGPGILAQALHRWYPKAEIYAVDVDSNYIAYARAEIQGVDFREGSAEALPFEDRVFDVTISHTVYNHVEPTAFFGEQKRVLKSGGACIVMAVGTRIIKPAECLLQRDEERYLCSKLKNREVIVNGKYTVTANALQNIMETSGFEDIRAGNVKIELKPDDRIYPDDMAEEIINAERDLEIDRLRMRKTGPERDKVLAFINKRYDERIDLYRKGQVQDDSYTSVTLIVRGRTYK